MGYDLGRVVYHPPQRHECAPGWRNEFCEGDPSGFSFNSGWYAMPPAVSDFPKGTVWQCSCGRAWVATGHAAYGLPGFRRERRRERRRREARR